MNHQKEQFIGKEVYMEKEDKIINQYPTENSELYRGSVVVLLTEINFINDIT